MIKYYYGHLKKKKNTICGKHMWKASVNALPVGTNLRRRGIEVDINCTRCGAVEIDIHVLLHCPICHKSLE